LIFYRGSSYIIFEISGVLNFEIPRKFGYTHHWLTFIGLRFDDEDTDYDMSIDQKIELGTEIPEHDLFRHKAKIQKWLERNVRDRDVRKCFNGSIHCFNDGARHGAWLKTQEDSFERVVLAVRVMSLATKK
jgi:hypothetical protein